MHIINETTARQAHEINSFHEYRPGSATSEYSAEVAEARTIAEKRKKATDESYHEQIDSLLNRYERKLADWYNKKFRIEGMCPSVMVAGPSNFPVRRKERQNNARDKHYIEYEYINKLLDKIRAVGTSISSDNPNAGELLRVKLEKLEKQQNEMKQANAHWRKHGTMAGFGKITAEDAASMDAKIKAGYHGQPCPAYQLTNNNANIKRIRERISELENAPEVEDWEFEGGRVEANKDANRIQIIYDSKPDEAVRDKLKSQGFRWSPRYGAWQRMLNANGIWAAKRVTEKLGTISAKK